MQIPLSKATYNWEYIKRLILKRQTEEVPITLSLRHCSNKYKLAREGEKEKEKDENIEKGKDFFFMMKSSGVKRDEFSVVA